MSYNRQGYSYYNPNNRRHYPAQGVSHTMNTQDVTYRGFINKEAAEAFATVLRDAGEDAEVVNHPYTTIPLSGIVYDSWVVVRHER